MKKIKNESLPFEKSFDQEKEEKILHHSLNNCCNKPKITYELNNGLRITKSAGYIPVKRQIEILQETGHKLEMLKNGTYDYQDENYSFDVTDPTRRLNFDIVDASELQKQTDKQIKEMKRQQYLNKVSRLKNLHNDIVDNKVSTGDNNNKEKLSPELGVTE